MITPPIAQHEESLGRRLVRWHEQQAAKERAQKLAEEEAAKQREAEKHVFVKSFFDKWKERITNWILNDSGAPNIVISRLAVDGSISELCGFFGKAGEVWPIYSRANKYHYVWQEFEAWGKSNELNVGFREVPEGNGFNHHYKLVISPSVE